MSPEQEAIAILEQVIHNPQLRFLSVKESCLVEQAFNTLVQLVKSIENAKKESASRTLEDEVKS